MIGYYVHHRGSGHLHRMLAITRHLGDEVTVLSSISAVADTVAHWLQLARDDTGEHQDAVTAQDTLHWAPVHDRGLARRHAQVTNWIVEAEPSLVVVDVSVEVSVLARLCGVPIVVMAMPGDRFDRPHELAYDMAEALVAPWPDVAPSTWPSRWLDKTTFSGSFSRFDGRERPPTHSPLVSTPADRRGLFVWGSGGATDGKRQFEELSTAAPDWTWVYAGPTAPLDEDELWAGMCAADVVVSHAGQNTVAEIAASRAPAVVVADERPFGEQVATTYALGVLDLAVALPAWPEPEAWPALLERAAAMDGSRWARWNPGTGAAVAASAIEACAPTRG